jgi:hypothetical protein
MPAGDGTGPMGLGPMTGRGAGYCGGFAMPGYMNPMPGRGMGMGWGRGRGRGRGRGWRRAWQPMGAVGGPPAYGVGSYGVGPYDAPPQAEHEAQTLRSQAEHLEQTLAAIKQRITQLEAPRETNG